MGARPEELGGRLSFESRPKAGFCVKAWLPLALESASCTATAADGQEAPRVIADAKPDVVLLDIRLPKANGIAVLKSLEESGHFPPTIILTTFDDDSSVVDGIRAGAKGYLLKDVSLEQLTTAIRVVASGGTLINPAVTEPCYSRLGQALSARSRRGAAGCTDTSRDGDLEIDGRRLQRKR
jgi:DNA-binding NarL/FixJ family response regulator